MKKYEFMGSTNWIFTTQKGDEVTVVYRESDFLIKHNEMTSQCPHAWFVISGNIDEFNSLSRQDNQSIVSVGMCNPDTGLSLLHIAIDTSELESIEADSFLNKYLTVGKLDKEDCIFN
ncbi:hypothetical protein [Colwellia psychrerythraea]|uniref:Uncharacterized protein n=1 Tax=Colwellia psychrerythraea TaxID=28229 RepID=A0A099KDG5_COLPS|nr:hypothetical protein [Colwellia psychrerythraea]KGJ88370.1 hypothetical protein ND2E_4206 [Colwellia psychrerythraea]